jgi:hypothetical protein
MLLILGLAAGCGASAPESQIHAASPRQFGEGERLAFTALRGPAHPVPSPLRRHLKQAQNPEIRTLRLDTAKYIATDTGFWIVNGPEQTCFLQTRGGAIGCESRATLLREGIALGVVTLGPPPRRAPREFLVAGIVPNRVKAVEVKVGERTRKIAVRDNAYSLRAPVPIVVSRLVPNR